MCVCECACVSVFVHTGDSVAVVLPLTALSAAVYLGIVLSGCVVVSIADSFAAHEVDSRLGIAHAKLVFTQVSPATHWIAQINMTYRTMPCLYHASILAECLRCVCMCVPCVRACVCVCVVGCSRTRREAPPPPSPCPLQSPRTTCCCNPRHMQPNTAPTTDTHSVTDPCHSTHSAREHAAARQCRGRAAHGGSDMGTVHGARGAGRGARRGVSACVSACGVCACGCTE